MSLRNARTVETETTEITIGTTTYFVELEVKHSSKYYIYCTLSRKVFLGRKEVDTLLRHTDTEDGVEPLSKKLTAWAIEKAHDRETARSLSLDISVDVTTDDIEIES